MVDRATDLASIVVGAPGGAGGLDSVIEDFSRRAAEMKREGHWNAGGIQSIVDALKAVKSGNATLERPGRMYEVNILADPERFLDWSKPISEQSAPVREAYERITGARDPKLAEIRTREIDEIMNALASDRDPVTKSNAE
ncbi:MAG TPA: hypothetical protein VFB29_00390 [Pseudolabrys sp.]|nr:hypothetical protein [Pseudolabrys sp.]